MKCSVTRLAIAAAAGFATAVGALAVSAELHERAMQKRSGRHLVLVPQARADRIYPNYGESEFR